MPHERVPRFARPCLALVVCLTMAGCASPPPVDFDRNPRLWMGGVHYRFVDEATVEAEGYLINLGETTFDDESFEVKGALRGKELDFADEATPIAGTGWKPGEARQWTAVFGKIPETTFRLTVEVTEDLWPWAYVMPCKDKDGVARDACTFPGPSERITPDNEHGWYDQLRACCEWLPPPFDVYDLECAIRGRDLACAAVIWNHARESGAASAEVTLYALPIEDLTPKRTATTRPVEVGSPLAPGEERRIEFVLEDILTDVSGEPSPRYEVALRASRQDMPKSAANETIIVRLASPPPIEADRTLGGSL